MANAKWIPKIIILVCLGLSLVSLRVFFSSPGEAVEAYNQKNLSKIRQVDNLNP
jgi:hypothetical protein